MNEAPVITKRRVEISVGLPDILEGAPVERNAAMPHHDECYFIVFVDVTEDDGTNNTLTAQTVCLCTLKAATAVWLQGGTEEEVKAMLQIGHEGGEKHE
jgi:hypothetical protein